MQCSTAAHSPQVHGPQPFPERITALRIDVPQGTQRIVMLQRCDSSPPDSPAVSPAGPPRLQSRGAAVHAYDWAPTITEFGGPSARFSFELACLHQAGFWCADPRNVDDMAFVRQSEGLMSKNLPLVSVGFAQCALLIFRNVDSGECLMMHHDSDVRSGWGETYAEFGGVPTSPSTPRGGLSGRPRCGIEEFLSERRPGRKRMVLVESERANDRRELFARYRARGVEVLPPLLLETRGHGAEDDEAEWDVVYKPNSDELMVHVKDGPASRVMHWDAVLGIDSDGFGKVPLLREVPFEDGDIVDRLPEYRAVLADPTVELPEPARKVLQLCVQAVEQRNETADDGRLLLELFKLRAVPLNIRCYLAANDLRERSSIALEGLTRLAVHALTPSAGSPDILLDGDSDLDSESKPDIDG